MRIDCTDKKKDHPKVALERRGQRALRLTEELDNRFHLRAGEYLGVVFITYSLHGCPHAACLVHLATEEAQRTIIWVVGVVHLRQVAKGIASYAKAFHRERAS